MSAIIAASPPAFRAGSSLVVRNRPPGSTLSRLSSGSRVHADDGSPDFSESGRGFALESLIRDAVLASNLRSIV
jgi:hypothetical protein